jgi:hypothetical protein
MRIAYMTTDEVNHALAAQLARKCGAVVHKVRPGDTPPDGWFDAVLYDLDNVPTDRRRAFLAQILAGAPARLTGIHGYDLTEEQSEALRMRGVAVAQRLQPDLLRALCRAVVQKLTTVPPDDALVDETWINLAQ